MYQIKACFQYCDDDGLDFELMTSHYRPIFFVTLLKVCLPYLKDSWAY